MLFRIPPSLKELVTVARRSAFERGDETVIAENVVCMVLPGRDLVSLNMGIPIQESDLRTDWTVLLEQPAAAIDVGDFMYRADGSELQVSGVRRLGDVMLLEINNVVIP